MAANSEQLFRKSKRLGIRRPTKGTQPLPAQSLNLEMAERFRRWLIAQKYSLSTQERYYRVAKKLCHHIGGKPLSAVTPMDIGDFLTQTLPDRWADSYLADQLGPLRSFFDFLYLGGVVDSVAPRFLKARARSKALPKALTRSQIRKLIRTAEHQRDRVLVELLYATGCRIGEIRLTRLEDVDFKRRTFRVRAKRKERIVYFGARATKALRVYLNERRSGYLFQEKNEPQRGYITHNKRTWVGSWKEYEPGKRRGTKRTKCLGSYSEVPYATAQRRFRRVLEKIDLVRYKRDQPLNRSALSTVVRELGRRAGIRVSPHAIRHSFATHFLENGGDIRALQELLGHTYLTSTQVYTRISDRAVRSAYRRFCPRG